MYTRHQKDLKEITSLPFFSGLDAQTSDEFYEGMSAKALFYFVLRCSPQVQREMLENWTKNPIRASMFIEYDQAAPNFTNLQMADLAQDRADNPDIKRIMHLDQAFSKFSTEADCNILSIGAHGDCKSTLLNQIFGFDFETTKGTDEKQCLLFHDSVDAIFASKQVGYKDNSEERKRLHEQYRAAKQHSKSRELEAQQRVGLSVFDFQGGKANYDFKLINQMLDRMPRTYLLIQFSAKNKSYLMSLVHNIGVDCMQKLLDQGRLLVVAKAFQVEQIQNLADSMQSVDGLDQLINDISQKAVVHVGDTSLEDHALNLQASRQQVRELYDRIIDDIIKAKINCK